MNQFIAVENLTGEETIINLSNVTCILPYAKNYSTVYFNGGDDDKVNIKPNIKDMKEFLGIHE